MTNEPTLGEALRRLDDVSRELKELAREMKADRADAAKLYVNQGVYLAERQAMEYQIADLHGDLKKVEIATGKEITDLKRARQGDTDARRQVWLAVATLAVGSLVTIAVTIVNLLRG